MDLGAFNWSLMTIVGPLLLLGAIGWAILHNRRRSRRDEERTEEATDRLYREEDRAHSGEDEDVP
ncbi:MAG: hypothetical protein ACFBQW_05140 [Sphingomonadaceae bacterium]